MLLIIEALLLISAVLQDNRHAVEGYTLDMADQSVDDQFYSWFSRCSKKMEHRVQTEFLEKEMTNSLIFNNDRKTTFAEVWTDAVMYSKTPEDNLSKNHSVAIYAYTNSKFDLYKKLNDAVRYGEQKYKDGTYSWYSLHFWLTEAIQILKKTQASCFDTYRRTKVEFDKNVKGKEVRFGQFASSSLERSIGAEKFGDISCFEIRTCSGADLTKYSAIPSEKEVLIPPYETFTVTDVQSRAEQKDLWCKTVYILKSYTTRSDLNCAASSGNQAAFFNVLFILIIFLQCG